MKIYTCIKYIYCAIFIALLVNSCIIISTNHYVAPASEPIKSNYRFFSRHHNRSRQNTGQLLLTDDAHAFRVYYDVPCWAVKGGSDLYVDLIIESERFAIPNIKINNIEAKFGENKKPLNIIESMFLVKYGDDENSISKERQIDLYGTDFKQLLQNMPPNSNSDMLFDDFTACTIRVKLDKNLRSLKSHNLFISFDIDINGKNFKVENAEYKRISDYYVVTPLHVAFYAAIGAGVLWYIIFSNDIDD